MNDTHEPRTGHPLSRRHLLRAAALAAPSLGMAALAGCGGANAASTQAPAVDWQRHDSPEAGGFSSARLKTMEAAMYPLETSSMMIVRGGRIAYSYGDITTASYLASARKSILSTLYGRHVLSGTINLDATIATLGIDDIGGLLPIEKTAKVRDIITARSGVYHEAGSPGSNPATPARGSKTPGSFFFYNNWDFNVAGFIYEKLTGKTIFNAFRDELAVPLQMQDFDFSRQRMLGFLPARSQYLAYHFFLSCRDMARLGLLLLNDGQWNGQQLVASSWVREMTTLRVTAADANSGGLGYAYLWWKPDQMRTSAAWRNSYLALGNYGQNILVLPEVGTVIVHRRYVSDEFAIARNLGETPVDKTGISQDQFLNIADLAVAAML